MSNNRRIVGVSLGALVALTAAASPPAPQPLDADASLRMVAFVSPLADAKPDSPAPAPILHAVPFQPAEWRVAGKDGASADPRPAEPVALVARAAGSPAGLDARNMECLARAIYYEARGEPLTGQAAVAHVILNRKKSGRFPTTVCGVVDQPGQFTFRAGRPEGRNAAQWARAQKVAAEVAAGDMANPVGPALFFHADHVAPGWRRPRVATIGNHIFYR
jgi:spore germination cell wall hydrolase CwlJ-like protein